MDSAEDFGVLLKMIYTPGYVPPFSLWVLRTDIEQWADYLRYEVPQFSAFASLLRMTMEYGFSHVRDQLLKDIKSAYPTKWEACQAADVLGEDVFGSPKPHPNAVLNLLVAHNVNFAIPFAAYCASLSGFPTLMNDKPCTVLPRHILASTIQDRGEILRVMAQATHAIAHKEKLSSVCPGKSCVLNVGIKPMERRMEAVTKLYDALVVRGTTVH